MTTSSDFQEQLERERIMASQQQPDPLVLQFRTEFERLCTENKQGFEDLARQGIKFDMGVLLSGQIECLYRTIAEAMGPVEGPRFIELAKLRWEQAIANEIGQAKDQGTKAQLSLGGSFSPGMIRELARSTGTFGA